MALSGKKGILIAVASNFRKNVVSHVNSNFQRFSSIATKAKRVKYPKVKTEYPPGKWGKISPEKAWERHEVRNTLMNKPTAKWRLEEMAGELPGRDMWSIGSVDNQPGTLLYKKYITKTHLEMGLPNVYDNVIENNLAERVRSQIMEVVLQERELCWNGTAPNPSGDIETKAPELRERIAKQIMDVLINNLSYDVPHLLESQVRVSLRNV